MNSSKPFWGKGIYLAIFLVLLHKVLCAIGIEAGWIQSDGYYFFTGALFGVTVLLFILTDRVSDTLMIGFTGLFLLIFTEMLLAAGGIGEAIFRFFTGKDLSEAWLELYVCGFVGSMIGAFVGIVLVFLKVKLPVLAKRGEVLMESKTKIKLLGYLALSALSFSYLVLPENAGVSVPCFALLQLLCLWFLVPNRKKLWLFAPIFILSLNPLISANSIWRVSNVLVSVVLYSVMFLDFRIRDTSADYFIRLLEQVIEPVRHFKLPVRWCIHLNQEKAPVVKRTLLALAITIPCVIVLIVVLSFADMVFSKGVSDLADQIFRHLNGNVVSKLIYGLFVGFYLFGLLYSVFVPREKDPAEPSERRRADLLILNILLCAITVVYTIFAVIQFRYLFAQDALPYGFSYSDYARKGFFELFFLTGVNIFLILLSVGLSKTQQGRWPAVTKWLCCFLCALTGVLLASSFYRMGLYSADDGLTRLRFLVFGFLLFEAVGLLITFFYIIKPQFQIVVVYLMLGLCYYLLLNLLPIDRLIAKNQIDRYFAGEGNGVGYVLTLSADAAPEAARLLSPGTSPELSQKAREYFVNLNEYYQSLVPRWQRYQLPVQRVQEIDKQEIKGK